MTNLIYIIPAGIALFWIVRIFLLKNVSRAQLFIISGMLMALITLFGEPSFSLFMFPLFYLGIRTRTVFTGLFIVLFNKGEKKIYEWMDHSISSDILTRSAIINGNFASTKAGEYLLNIKEQFEPDVFFDMVCYFQLFLELRIEKQSDMLLRQAGFGEDDSELRHAKRSSKKAELAALARQIGKTGMSVLAPLVQDGI